MSSHQLEPNFLVGDSEFNSSDTGVYNDNIFPLHQDHSRSVLYSKPHPVSVLFARLQPFLRQVASNQFVFASQSGRAVLTMPMLLGGIRIVCVIDTGAAGVFCSSAIQSRLRSEAAKFYKRAHSKTLRLNTAEGLTSGVFESFTIPVSIESSVDTFEETFTVLPKLADDICLLGMSCIKRS